MAIGYKAWVVRNGVGTDELAAILNELEGDLYKPTVINISPDGSWVVVARKAE